MVLPLIPVIGLGFLVTFVVLYGMTHGLQTWLASLLNALAHPQGTFWQRVLLKPVALAVQAIAYVFRTVGHACSQVAAHSIPRVAHWLDGLAMWVTHNATIAGSFADEVARGFERLVAHTIPHAVSRAIAIPIHEVQIGIRTAERDLERLRIYARGIDRLVRDTIIPDIRRLARAIDITLPRSIGRVGHRVGAIEDRLANPPRAWVKRMWKYGWLLIGASLVTRYLTTHFKWLFCRNVTKVAKSICNPLNNLLVDLLLGEAVAAFAIADICQVVKAIELVAEGFEPVIRELVTAEDDFFDWCGNDLPTAHDTPGYSGAWLATGL